MVTPGGAVSSPTHTICTYYEYIFFSILWELADVYQELGEMSESRRYSKQVGFTHRDINKHYVVYIIFILIGCYANYLA